MTISQILVGAVPLKKRNAQTTKDFSGNVPITSKRKLKLIGTDRGKEFKISFFKIPRITITLNTILETAYYVLFLLKDLFVLSEIYSKELFLKKEMVIGLMYYLQ